MSTDASTDRGPRPDEPDVPYILITSVRTGGHNRALHIPGAGGQRPVCGQSLQNDDAYWNAKPIETHPPSWRDEKWCGECLEWWREFRETDGMLAEQSGKIEGVELSRSIKEELDGYCARAGVSRLQAHRRALRAFLGVDTG